jgi:hypothetical protein
MRILIHLENEQTDWTLLVLQIIVLLALIELL